MDVPPPTDAALIAATLAGDPQAFRALMERHQRAIFGYLYRLLFRDAESARELTQTVFMKAYEHLASVDRERPFTPWLYRIAHNEAANWMRTRERHPETGLEPEQWSRMADPAGDSPEAAQAAEQDRALLLRALDSLPDRQREALVLFYFEERSYEEIAAILDVRLGTVGTLIHRAKEQLRKRLDGALAGHHDQRGET
jgi:RNA polymerase sigma-70 factor (ECF subfamily)